jgi:hypothetical protein
MRRDAAGCIPGEGNRTAMHLHSLQLMTPESDAGRMPKAAAAKHLMVASSSFSSSWGDY